MAKKSRRRKLPTEKDFERLNAPKQEPKPVKDEVPVSNEPTESPSGADTQADSANEVEVFDAESVDAVPDEAALADEDAGAHLTYSVDGGMSVSLAGDITGGQTPGAEEGSEETSEADDDLAFDEPAVGRGTDEEEPEEEAGEEELDDDAPRPPEVLILVGSPRTDGKSALFGNKLSEYLRLSGAAVTLYEIGKYPVAACTGCGVCSKTGLCCIKGDAWNVLSRHMDSCAALVVIAPIYFAGPSGWLKAALDRCQVYWARKYVLKDWIPRKRPAHLLVIGDGGDPYGSEPLETICTSALNCANLRIVPERITRMIGDQFDLRHAVTLAGQVMASIGRE